MIKLEVVFEPKNVLRYPRLDTVLMVEKAIYKSKGEKTVSQIWKALPRKVMWQTFTLIMGYLEQSGKIAVAPDRHVIWVWAPKEIEALKKRGLVVA